jgi:hypothetical protein
VIIGGELSARSGQDVQLMLTVTPRRADDLALTQRLSAIGTPDGAGWRVNWSTPWR